MRVIDYCRECCCEINETTVVCPECGKRFRQPDQRRMSIGKWIGLTMVVLATPVGIFTAGADWSAQVFTSMFVWGLVIFGLSPWREPKSKLEPTNDNPDATYIVIVAGL